MTVHLLDHIYFVLIALAMPVYGYFWLRKRAALIKAGRTDLRLSLYRTTIREEWVLAIVLVGLWFFLGRSAAELGLGLPGGLLAWGGYALAALLCAAMLIQMNYATTTPERRAAFRRQVGDLAYLMPHTLVERRTFDRVSVTAGVCEELIYRGFGIAYLTAVPGVPFWAAALISSLIFGLVHSYQGPAGAVRAGTLGLILATVYGLTGALWAPILLHALMDITSGRMAYAAFSSTCPDGTAPELAA